MVAKNHIAKHVKAGEGNESACSLVVEKAVVEAKIALCESKSDGTGVFGDRNGEEVSTVAIDFVLGNKCGVNEAYKSRRRRMEPKFVDALDGIVRRNIDSS